MAKKEKDMLNEILEPVAIEAVEMQEFKMPEMDLKRGEAEVIQIDESGNQIGQPFITDINTAVKYYNSGKFKITKKK